jgi:serine/threonine protein phosphatase PrpC
MSTQSLVSRRQGSKCLPAFAVLGGLLIIWLALSSTAFATQLANSPAGNLGLLRAGVSVVRLLVTYEKPNNSKVYCTGLGAIVASWPARNPDDQSNWILTDSSLVNGNCANEHPQTAPISIEVYLSTAFNQQGLFLEGSLASVACQDQSCHSGPALFALGGRSAQNLLLPFLDLAQQPSTSGQNMGVELTTSASTVVTSHTNTQPPLPTPSLASSNSADVQAFQTQAEQFRTPKAISSTATLEAGAPLINSNGQLTALHLAGSSASNDLQTFIKQKTAGSHSLNQVQDGWQRGIDAYNKGDLRTTREQFQIAAKANSSFQAEQILAPSATPTTSHNDNGQSNSANTLTIAGISIALWQLVLVIIGLLAVLLLLITLLRVRHQRALENDLTEAAQRATIDAQQIAEMEWAKAQQIAEMEAIQQAKTQQPLYQQPTQESLALTPTQPIIEHLPCPRCGELVPKEAKYCSNCRLLLSLTESGMHLRSQVANRPVVPNHMLSDQPTLPTPPVPAMSATSIPEQPTQEITPDRTREQPDELATTEIPSRPQQSGTHFKLVVGTRSDVGIKRQYKPNEDSLFAAQGLIDEASTTHPYGLFIIADGMGGHANGQHASRLAIQTIIEHILPRLSKNAPLSNDEYAKLIVEGIQRANQAVHQRNIEQHGDMGTTVTGALVVDNLAYIINVGDSRTYLYREQDRLKKITNDHSVVASLVEAGIIKPDDIYTHPKRSHIYRSLGEKPHVDIDLFTVELQEGDKLLLCSDGLWDMVRDPKIEDVVKNPNNPVATSEALVQAAYEGGGEDNVSVIVVNVAEPAKTTSMPKFDVIAKPDTVQMPQM